MLTAVESSLSENLHYRSVIRNTATGADYEEAEGGVTQDVNVYVNDDVEVPGFIAVSDMVGEDAGTVTVTFSTSYFTSVHPPRRPHVFSFRTFNGDDEASENLR